MNIVQSSSKKALPDFVALYKHYEILSKNGNLRSQLGKRIGKPEELRDRPAYYRLFPGESPPKWGERVIFLMPFCTHQPGAVSLGQKLAEAKISEARLLQVIRADYDNDLIQLRRLVQHVAPPVDWSALGTTLYFWNEKAKRELLEDFFIHQSAKPNK
ncbi:type I-E CRISPR-associated protein Cse2/CasB [Candidatus Nitrotoga sp. AM1P]|uniref:type I-E CRISPR-associated protein Cse2/CasB n=1 Tax=Candidatus Nitrotoga sp. AM1P TaxID=2559597 RepID=UPI0010B5AD3F|nr:type I-E CRISPR-associated protein Cse2/CasB [Candidatus Nitrotoga sp. AM1P]BBJ22996.1 type I-E CRISPR-associated protein CasB [Candidatus Nitrotoga sp. AM1P]